MTEKPICLLRVQDLACDWSKHNEHSRNLFSVHGFLSLSVKTLNFCLTCMLKLRNCNLASGMEASLVVDSQTMFWTVLVLLARQ